MKAKESMDRENSHREQGCRHSIVERRILTGDPDFAIYGQAGCAGNKRVMEGLQGKRGTLCIRCSTVRCEDPSCLCKRV